MGNPGRCSAGAALLLPAPGPTAEPWAGRDPGAGGACVSGTALSTEKEGRFWPSGASGGRLLRACSPAGRA